MFSSPDADWGRWDLRPGFEPAKKCILCKHKQHSFQSYCRTCRAGFKDKRLSLPQAPCTYPVVRLQRYLDEIDDPETPPKSDKESS